MSAQAVAKTADVDNLLRTQDLAQCEAVELSTQDTLMRAVPHLLQYALLPRADIASHRMSLAREREPLCSSDEAGSFALLHKFVDTEPLPVALPVSVDRVVVVVVHCELT